MTNEKPIRMPKELKEKWFAALRSGEYQQGYGKLFDGTGYCCLGVLQMVVDGKVEPQDAGICCLTPTDAWLSAHGISASREFRYGYGHNMSAPWLNDHGRLTFPEIADTLEPYIETY